MGKKLLNNGKVAFFNTIKDMGKDKKSSTGWRRLWASKKGVKVATII